ncbi:MAG: MBL fold metallo-hydrolase [Burkholderiaceae bacterium]
MQVIILGSGSPMPDPNRAGPSTLVRAGGRSFLFDCGRGVLMRAAAVKAGAAGLNGLFITHMHSDHTTDFNDVITTRWIMSPGVNPLRVFGPQGIELFAERTLAALEHDIGYRLSHHQDLHQGPSLSVSAWRDGSSLEEDGLRITAAATDHSPVHPTLGYRIEFEGKVVAIAGDTVPCEGLERICMDADVYVQTVIRSDLIRQSPSGRLRDVIDYHSDVAQAGETAARCRVRTLVLNHLVPPPPPGQEQVWAEAAGAHFGGRILVAHDLLEITC